jgi:uncharacterized protein (UPF0335 family)
MLGNKAPILKEIVEAIVDLENKILDKREERKGVIDQMKKNKLPAAELIRVAKQDADKAATNAKKLRDAAGILGSEVYAEAVKPDVPDDVDQTLVDVAKQLVGQVESIDDDLKSLAKDVKGKYKEAKEAELSIPVIKQIVTMKLEQQDYAAFGEYSLTMQAYWQAIG